MSLINQVLRDLEKRGSGMPNAAASSIHPVPLQPGWTKVARLIGSAMVLFAVLGGVLWVAVGQDSAPVLAGMASQPAPSPVLHHAAVPAASTVQSASAVQPASIAQPQISGATSAVPGIASGVPETLASSTPATHLGSDPIATPLPGSPSNIRQNAPQEDASTKQAKPANPPKKNAVTKHNSVAVAADQKKGPIKRVNTQQQAEGEFNQALELIQQGRKDGAQQHLEAALQLNPAHGQARQALVGLLLENKLNAEAERVLQDGLKFNPKQLDFAVLLARLQVERNALPQALDTLQKMQLYAGDQANYHAFLAAVLQRQNRHNEAVAHYQTALRQSPNSGVWLMGLGISLQALKRNEEARDAFRRAIESHSLSADLQDFVGRRMKEL